MLYFYWKIREQGIYNCHNSRPSTELFLTYSEMWLEGSYGREEALRTLNWFSSTRMVHLQGFTTWMGRALCNPFQLTLVLTGVLIYVTSFRSLSTSTSLGLHVILNSVYCCYFQCLRCDRIYCMWVKCYSVCGQFYVSEL